MCSHMYQRISQISKGFNANLTATTPWPHRMQCRTAATTAAPMPFLIGAGSRTTYIAVDLRSRSGTESVPAGAAQ